MSTGVPPMLVSSTNSAPAALLVGLYIHSVITTWPGTAAVAGEARATETTVVAARDTARARARIRPVRMGAVFICRTCP
jgi:hypothetical protein